jgi:dephospho-CoA kinase
MARAVILTGGIGSGKSSVAALLARWGAHVVDADQLAREVVAPGTDGLSAVADLFGTDVIGPDGSLDRTTLAERVFGHPDRLSALEAIIHPRVERLAGVRLAEGSAAPVVVYEVPLPGRRPQFPGSGAEVEPLVVVVDAGEDQRLERLRARGLSDDQIAARMSAQPSREEWNRAAEVVIDNTGDLDALVGKVAQVWLSLTGAAPPVGGSG